MDLANGKNPRKEPVSRTMGEPERRFKAMVEAHAADLYRYACWLSGHRAEAEDLVQETLARAWRALDQLRAEGAAKSWLFTTLRREHARQFERVRPLRAEVVLDEIADPRRSFDDGAEAHALRLALAGLGAEYRDPLMLQVLGGFSGDEIATMLNLSVSAVNVRLHRARQRLRSTLDGIDGVEREVARS
jgi:RNA polymerase sigma-70 factor (ECF subfamily)